MTLNGELQKTIVNRHKETKAHKKGEKKKEAKLKEWHRTSIITLSQRISKLNYKC